MHLILIVVALLNLPLITVLLRSGVIDQPTAAVGAGIAVVVVVAIAFYGKISNSIGSRHWRLGMPGVLLLLFIAQIGISSWVNQLLGARTDGTDIWQRYVMTFHPALLFFVFKDLVSDTKSHAALLHGFDLLTIAITASVLLAFMNVYGGESYGFRQFGILGDQVSWLLSALFLANLARGKWILCGVSALALVATGSRGAMLVAVVALAIQTLFVRERNVRSLLSKWGMVVVALIVALSSPELVGLLLNRIYETDLVNNDRISTTLFTLGIFQDFPILGGGFNAHSYYFDAFGVQPSSYDVIFGTPVSALAQVLADSGIAGGVFFVCFVISILHVSLKLMRWNKLALVQKGRSEELRSMCSGFAAWAIAFLIFNQTATYFLPVSMIGELTFVVLGCVVGCREWQISLSRTHVKSLQAANPGNPSAPRPFDPSAGPPVRPALKLARRKTVM